MKKNLNEIEDELLLKKKEIESIKQMIKFLKEIAGNYKPLQPIKLYKYKSVLKIAAEEIKMKTVEIKIKSVNRLFKNFTATAEKEFPMSIKLPLTLINGKFEMNKPYNILISQEQLEDSIIW